MFVDHKKPSVHVACKHRSISSEIGGHVTTHPLTSFNAILTGRIEQWVTSAEARLSRDHPHTMAETNNSCDPPSLPL